MVKFLWLILLFAQTILASDNELPVSDTEKSLRYLPLYDVKRYDRPIGGGLPPLTSVPVAGERCSARLESALDQLKRRKRNQPKSLDMPMSQSIDLNGYSLYQAMRSAPVDMYVTRMRVRLPQNSNWVRVEKCYFDPRNVSLDTMLLFHDLTISGNVDLYEVNELDRTIPPSRRLRRNHADVKYDNGYSKSRGTNGCNMILRLRKAGIGFHTRPLNQQPGKFNVKTDSEFVEPGFISVYAYGCEKYINKNGVRNKDNLPLRRRKRSDEFTFEPGLETSSEDDKMDARSSDNWDIVYEPSDNRLNYERSKLFRPEDNLDEMEDISREMEDIFTKGIRTLLTTYMKKELQPAIKDTLMRNMGYVISYG
ncbi:putative NUF1 [Danaus plexippus plexippus]|uniref:NUF1 n=1 Tax=Danaus plexippus plexippus TaxID=278856 RepID=A0A212EI45_DANPL|nr:putative NUF1 [Danaus plexippus plexippus]